MDFSSNWVISVWMGFTWKEVGYLPFPRGSYFAPRPCVISTKRVGEIHASRETRRKRGANFHTPLASRVLSLGHTCLSCSVVRLTDCSLSIYPHISFIARDFFNVISQFASSLFHCTWPPMIIPRRPFRFLIWDRIIRNVCFDCRFTRGAQVSNSVFSIALPYFEILPPVIKVKSRSILFCL